MKKIYKNSNILMIPIDDTFSAVVNPKHPNFMRLINQDQVAILEQLESGKTVEELSLALKQPVSVLNSIVTLFEKNGILNFTGHFKRTSEKKDIQNVSFWVHLTDFCNLKCSYCYISTKETKKSMSQTVLDQLEFKIEELVKKNPNIKRVHLKLSGGEVFSKFHIWKDSILSLVKRLREKDINVSIGVLTNLTILNDEIIDFLKEEKIGLGVSLDGLEEYNDNNRVYANGKGSFNILKDNLMKLKTENIRFGIMTVVSNGNLDGLEELTKFLIENNMSFRFSDVKDTEFDREKFYQKLMNVYDLMEENITNGFSFKNKHSLCDLNIKSPSENVCSMGINGAAIYLDGSIYFCHTHFGTDKSIGTLFENRDLLEIIESGNHYTSSLSSECDDCMYKMICAGGCPVYRVNGKSLECELFKKTIPRIYKLLAKEKLRGLNSITSTKKDKGI